MNRRHCINNPDNFCYICGKFTTSAQRRKLCNKVKISYTFYFGCKVGDQDKSIYAALRAIQSLLSGLVVKETGCPLTFHEPTYHEFDYYVCMTKGFT